MPSLTSLDRLAQAAYWYYVQDLGQAEVARRLGTSRSNVSRLLRAARERGVIRFEITHPIQRDLTLEERTRARFAADGVGEVVVTRASGENAGSTDGWGTLSVARAGADWLGSELRDGQTVGLFWGGTVRTMVDVARFERHIDAHVVQLGGEWSDEPHRSGRHLVRDLAVKLGGDYQYFNAPAFAPVDADVDGQISASLDAARSADVSVLGVGAFGQDTSTLFVERARASEAEIAEARRAGVVGQLAGRFFDADGRQADISLHRRLVSLELSDLRGMRTVALVAAGTGKARAVRSAIRGGLIDVLVCDAELASQLLEQD